MSINRGQYGEVGAGGFQSLEELANLLSHYLDESFANKEWVIDHFEVKGLVSAHIAEDNAHPQYRRLDELVPLEDVRDLPIRLSDIEDDISQTKSDLTSHNTDNVRHITADERSDWNSKVAADDPRLDNSREWIASTVPQAEAEAGTATYRRAWTAQRVRQAIAAFTEIFTSAEKTKLGGIATGATANSTDAQLRARSSHTGEQAIGTVTGLQAALNSKVETDTTYTVGSGLTLSGTEFSLPVASSGTGTFVTGVTQTANGITVTLGTPPNTNTTYSEITEAEVALSTSSTARLISGRRLRYAVDYYGLQLGTTVNTAAAGNHTHNYLPLSGGKLSGSLELVMGPATIDFVHIDGSTSYGRWAIGGDPYDLKFYNMHPEGVGGGVKSTILFSSDGLITAPSFSGSGASLTSLNASNLSSGTVPAARIPTLNQSTTGNAATATALTNARTINGTSFNGTADISTANWGTGRTLTIGSTGKTVNGSGNVAWTLAEIGAAAASHSHSYLPLAGGTLTGRLDVETASPTLGFMDTSQTGAGSNWFLHNAGKVFYALVDHTGDGTWDTPHPMALDQTGNVTFNGNVTAFSDSRVKTNIITISDALSKVKKLRGVNYTRKDSGKYDIGLIAQEVREVLPEVVLEGHTDEKYLSVAYGNMVGLLIEAIKEQQVQIDELKDLLKVK